MQIIYEKQQKEQTHNWNTFVTFIHSCYFWWIFSECFCLRSLSILYLTWWIFIRIFPSLSLFPSLSFNFHPLNALEFENDCGSECETCALNSPLRMSNGTSSTPQTPISGKLNNYTRTKKNIERRKVLSFISFFSGLFFCLFIVFVWVSFLLQRTINAFICAKKAHISFAIVYAIRQKENVCDAVFGPAFPVLFDDACVYKFNDLVCCQTVLHFVIFRP